MTILVFDMDTAAAYLGIKKSTLETHRYRGSFPKPIRRFGRTPVWAQYQLDEWQANRPGKPGRPRTRERDNMRGVEPTNPLNYADQSPRKDESDE